MTPDELKLIAELPVLGILIWIIVQQQNQIKTLTATIIELTKTHAEDLIAMACEDVGRVPVTGNHSPTPEKSSDLAVK